MSNPRLFISYCWSSADWVLDLATLLRRDGVDVVLDKWELKEGQDLHSFMESMVIDPSIEKVAIVCDPAYRDKANNRSGGVGAETLIITPDLYAKREQTKFVPIIAKLDEDGTPPLPAYIKSRIYIDLSDPDKYSQGYEQLLRWIFDKPKYVKPALGEPPAFLSDETSISLDTSLLARRAVERIRLGHPAMIGSLDEYLTIFAANFERFRITDPADPFDEEVVKNIEAFIPSRNEVNNVIGSIARYCRSEDAWRSIHRFFEALIPYTEQESNATRYRGYDIDNFKFIVHELFLGVISILLREERFEGVAHLVRTPYFVKAKDPNGRDSTCSFSGIFHYIPSLDELRKTRLSLPRRSVHSDFIEQRSHTSGIAFRHIMQADLVLYIRDCFDSLRSNTGQYWRSISLLFAHRQNGAFEVFARCKSKSYFDRMKVLFDIQKKEDFHPLADAYRSNKLRLPQWDYHSLNPFELMGYDEMEKIP